MSDRLPTPAQPIFWDARALEREQRRVFDVCQGCRRCFNLCESFPAMFQRIDEVDGDVDRLGAKDLDRVTALCMNCNVCGFVMCPYTPPHQFEIDFPRLMIRSKAVGARSRGLSWRDRLLSDTDRMGRLNSRLAPLVNRLFRIRAIRIVMEWVIGIHRDRRLPPFVVTTFPRLFLLRRQAKPTAEPVVPGSGERGASPADKRSEAGLSSPRGPQSGHRVALFSSCLVDYSYPEIGRAAVDVLEHNGVEVALPAQQCCGMPSMSVGDLSAAVQKAVANVASLLPWIERGYRIVTPMPSCSLMLKKEYPYLLGTPEAQRVADQTSDLCEYLMQLHKEGILRTDFVKPGGTIAYHLPCHLRDQKLGYKSRDLLALIPGTQIQVMEWCSGHDGTWSLEKDYFPLSLKIGRKVFDQVEQTQADLVVSDCSLAGNQIAQATGRPVSHPIEVLRRAYGLGTTDY
ncbi:MAG TPA: anaerobic glycerol-3-phosphate dehydrogenase subunit C [Nitrospiria bacterium]|nr:anaerobic glycerol-3-phosphate dehydrogenase subunit C [Nitrospiria bacterium]